jgi:hypothetical protein
VVPPEQRELRQEPARFLGGEGPPLGGVQHLVGIDSASGRRDLADRVGLNGAFVDGELQDPQQWTPERFGVADTISAIFEVAIALGVAGLLARLRLPVQRLITLVARVARTSKSSFDPSRY